MFYAFVELLIDVPSSALTRRRKGSKTVDAYQTGLSLWALASADPSVVDTAVYRRGVDYLMQTQANDSSWHVRSRAFGFQPYFEGGFPYGDDQWISMAATAWAAMVLMPASERERIATVR
jgi:N-acyl-D-amino-acid deacylase